MLDTIKWYGNATFTIGATPLIMIDPYSIFYEGPTPDIILISHEDYDHCSPADIEKLRGSNTTVIASRTAAEFIDGDVQVMRPWQVINFGRTSIKTVPAYTFSGDHPAHREDLGFVISQNYTDIYYAGDTDFIPELRDMRCDIAILPAASRVASLESMTEFAQAIRPRYVIPSHLSNSRASQVELQAFTRELSPHTDVVNLPLASGTTDDTSELFAIR